MLLVQELNPGDKDGDLNESGQLITEVSVLQQYLARIGLDPGEIDGVYGEKVRRAVMEMQRGIGISPTGKIDRATMEAVFNSCD